MAGGSENLPRFPFCGMTSRAHSGLPATCQRSPLGLHPEAPPFKRPLNLPRRPDTGDPPPVKPRYHYSPGAVLSVRLNQRNPVRNSPTRWQRSRCERCAHANNLELLRGFSSLPVWTLCNSCNPCNRCNLSAAVSPHAGQNQWLWVQAIAIWSNSLPSFSLSFSRMRAR
jgi:hypothetical protein